VQLAAADKIFRRDDADIGPHERERHRGTAVSAVAFEELRASKDNTRKRRAEVLKDQQSHCREIVVILTRGWGALPAYGYVKDDDKMLTLEG
jgi:hypothetical protein